MFEVELKYRVRKSDLARVERQLLDRCVRVPAQQIDTYLQPPEAKMTRRVRREETPDGVKYLLTDKRKTTFGTSAKDEREHEISQIEYAERLKEALIVGGFQVRVQKTRIHFHGRFNGKKATICLDRAKGPNDIRLGVFVELEMVVATLEEVAVAQKLLEKLAKQLLPASAQREERGYRSLILEALNAPSQLKAS